MGKTPQEKKRLSYLKERRNAYGESTKASRKAIPLRKRINNRSLRRTANQEFQPGSLDAELSQDSAAEIVEIYDRKRWRKWPDATLKDTLISQFRRRGLALPGRETMLGRMKFKRGYF